MVTTLLYERQGNEVLEGVLYENVGHHYGKAIEFYLDCSTDVQWE
jgi:hypothetical protein